MQKPHPSSCTMRRAPHISLSIQWLWVAVSLRRMEPSDFTILSSKAPPPNFDSSVVCEVLRVTVHHAKFLHGDSKVHSLSSHRLFRWVSGVPLHPAAHTGPSLVRCVLRLQYEIRMLQAMNAAKPWQRDFEWVCLFSKFLYYRTGHVCLKKEALVKLWCESTQ